MREFWIRVVSLVAVVGILMGYNSVLDARAKDEEIAKLQAKVTETKVQKTKTVQNIKMAPIRARQKVLEDLLRLK